MSDNKDIQVEDKKAKFRSKEWMAEMRQKALAKKAENKKLKEAQSLLKKKENEELLKKAEAIKNPKPEVVEPVAEPVAEPEPVYKNEAIEPKTSRKKKPVIIDSDDEELPDYKQAYYKAKLKKIKQPQTPQQPIPQEIAFDVAKSSVKQHFNKAMMGQLWRTYFGSEDCPY